MSKWILNSAVSAALPAIMAKHAFDISIAQTLLVGALLSITHAVSFLNGVAAMHERSLSVLKKGGAE